MSSPAFEPDPDPLDPLTFLMQLLAGGTAVFVSHGLWVVAMVLPGGVLGLMFIGLAQMVYVVPYLVVAAVMRWRGAMVGIALMATVTFLLNAGCYGLILGVFALGL